jgi:hypothetical protein
MCRGVQEPVVFNVVALPKKHHLVLPLYRLPVLTEPSAVDVARRPSAMSAHSSTPQYWPRGRLQFTRRSSATLQPCGFCIIPGVADGL